MYKLNDKELKVIRWIVIVIIGGYTEDLMENPGFPDEYSIESLIDGAIENWQEMADEELDELQEGLADLIMIGSGRFDYELDEAKQAAITKEFLRYLIG